MIHFVNQENLKTMRSGAPHTASSNSKDDWLYPYKIQLSFVIHSKVSLSLSLTSSSTLHVLPKSSPNDKDDANDPPSTATTNTSIKPPSSSPFAKAK